MPKATTSRKSNATQPRSTQKSLFVFIYENRRVMATRQTSYESALASARKLFPTIPRDHQITFHTREMDICDGELTEISPESWEEVVGEVNRITVKAEAPQPNLAATLAQALPTPRSQDSETSPRISLKIDIYGLSPERKAMTLTLKTTPSTSIHALCKAVESNIHATGNHEFTLASRSAKNNYVITFEGERLSPCSTVGESGIENGDVMEVVPVQCGGKPVIYLFSPETVEASVKLTLVPEWSLSAIYPVVSIKPNTLQSNEEVNWRVRVHPNGELTDLSTGLDVAYLFWEAHTNPTRPASPPTSPLAEASREVFSPNDAVLSADNAVVLHVDKITPYLDSALVTLGLHTEARTSFITYWLPAMLKHRYVALRFLPQSAYERAAPLDISPTPDVVTRVFMLFQGIPDDSILESGEWEKAVVRAENDVARWREVVGVDVERAADKSLFRVLEWGGMEVLRSSRVVV